MTDLTAPHRPVAARSDLDGDAITKLSATEMARMVRARELDPVDLIDATLRRIGDLDPDLHAFIAVLDGSARDTAEELRERPDLDTLPLAGVPVAIKDNVPIAGEPTTHGSAATSKHPASDDALIVRRLRDAGAVIVGRTVMPELAVWPFTEPAAFAAPRNPWNLERTPGGSSGGSAVAVAARMAALAVGSDGGGSIRVPAACCGIVGVKPAPGLVPIPERDEHWYGMTAFGPLARTVADAALLLDVLAGSSAHRDPVAALGGLRIRVSNRHPMFGVHPSREVRDRLAHAVRVLQAAGHVVTSAEPRYPIMPTEFTRRWLAGIAQDATGLDLGQLEPRTAAMVRRGRRAQRKVRPASESPFAAYISRWLQGCDVLITPVLTSSPVPIGKWRERGWISSMLGVGRWLYTSMWNVAGVAAVVVPSGTTADGLPIGVQLIGPAGSEPMLLSVAAQLEQLNPWPQGPAYTSP